MQGERTIRRGRPPNGGQDSDGASYRYSAPYTLLPLRGISPQGETRNLRRKTESHILHVPLRHSPFGGWRHHLSAPLGSVSLDSQSPTAPCESSSLATARNDGGCAESPGQAVRATDGFLVRRACSAQGVIRSHVHSASPAPQAKNLGL